MEAGSSSEMVTADDNELLSLMADVDIDGAPKMLIKGNNSEIPSSVTSVLSNSDLLVEILLRLPVLSLILFKSVSKHWLKIITSPNFTLKRSQIPNLNPVSALFLNLRFPHSSIPYRYDFVSLDIRIPTCSVATTFTFGPEAHGHVEIMQSCNGLLLFHKFMELYVYNPSITNMFKVIPKPDNDNFIHSSGICGLKLAYDPTKSSHYKVIYGKIKYDYVIGLWVQIHTYSSETGNWSVCKDPFPYSSCIEDGIYWNDAFYWIDDSKKLCKLDIVNEHRVLTTLQTPLTVDGKVHNESRLFESRGCLLLVGKDNVRSRYFTIYEKGNVYAEWSVKYIVNLDDIIKPSPRRWSVRATTFGIVLGEREEDSFLVLKLKGKVVQHKIMSKTLHTISNLGPYNDLVCCYQFIYLLLMCDSAFCFRYGNGSSCYFRFNTGSLKGWTGSAQNSKFLVIVAGITYRNHHLPQTAAITTYKLPPPTLTPRSHHWMTNTIIMNDVVMEEKKERTGSEHEGTCMRGKRPGIYGIFYLVLVREMVMLKNVMRSCK